MAIFRTDTACNLSDRARNIIIKKKINKDEYNIIKKKADEAKMSMSDSFLTSALKDNSRIPPEVMVKLQNVANDATSADQEFAHDKADEIQKGVDALWQILM